MKHSPLSVETSLGQPTLLDALTGRFYACYHEFYRSDRILVDHQANRAFPEMIKDFPQLKALPLCQRVSQLTSVVRSRWFDQLVIDFLAQYPDAVVVNLRSRLCTRYWRLPLLHDHWYEVDCPSMMALRQKYFTIVPRELDIACDCLEFEWMQKIQRSDEQPLLILMEGVSMYLTPQQNQSLFEAIAQSFGPVHLLFDGISPRFVSQEPTSMMPASENFLGEQSSHFQWGVQDIATLNTWDIHFSPVQTIEYLLDIVNYPGRLEPWMHNFWPMLKPLLQESGKIYHLYLDK